MLSHPLQIFQDKEAKFESRMEDEYEYTVPCDDMVVLESPSAESGLLNLGINTEVLDVCKSAQCSGDLMEDYCDKEVVLDSDDERGNQNEAVNFVNGRFPVTGRFSGRDATGLLRRRQVPSGCFRRLDNKVRERMRLDSARSERSDGEITGGRSSLYNDNRFQEHHVVVDSVASMSPEHKPIPSDPANTDFFNLVTENLTEESLEKRKLSSHESKFMDLRRDTNYDCKLAEFNYDESPETAESHDKALRFVDHYISVSDLGSYKDIQTRKTNMTKSPPSLRSMGSQSLARRVNLGSSAGKLTTFDWCEKQIEKDEYTSLRMKKNSIFEFEDEKSGCFSVNQESDHVNLPNKITNLQSKEKKPGNVLSPYDLDAESLNCNHTDNTGSNSGIRVANDSMEMETLLDAGLLRENVEKVEQCSLMPEQCSLMPDALDIGLDTQVAAEAMEELIHAFPPRSDAYFTHQGSDNTLLDSSNSVNDKCKPNRVANHVETFVGWRCKRKRSKCTKISTIQDKSISWLAAKQFKNQMGTVVQSLITEKLMNGGFLSSRNPGNMSNKKCGPPPGVTVQLEEYGFIKQYSLKGSQKHHCLSGQRSKETGDCIKSASSSKRRKMITLHEVKGTCLKSNIGSSFKVKTDTAETEETSNLDVAHGTFAKLNQWVYPKGKRAHQRTPRHSISSSNRCSKNEEKFPIMHKEACNRGAKLLAYNRQRRFPLGKVNTGISSKLASDLSSSVNDCGVSNRQLQIPTGSDTEKQPIQCGILDNLNSSSLDASSSKDLLSNRHSMTLQVLEGSGKRKQALDPLSRSPLMKELTRLGYTESLPYFLPKDSRRRRATEKVCVLFSQNLERSTLKQQKKIVARLGLSVASCCSDATHFVTDRFVRTMNMLEAIALGKPVVTHLWLESCEQAGCVIDEKSYILRDEKKEKEIGFNMPVSLSRASKFPILKGRSILITPNVKPRMDVIISLVKAVQGQAVQNILTDKVKDKLIPEDLLIISCEEDHTICLQFLEEGASIYDSELLLNGIVTQKLEYKRYRLFKDF